MRDIVEHWLWLVPALPLLGCAVNLFFGRFLPRIAVSLVACGSVLGSFVLALLAWRAVTPDAPLVWEKTTWIAIPGALGFSLTHGLWVDALSAVMILVVTGVGFGIHVYSTGYMADDRRYSRYFAFLNLFTAFMLTLVLGKNLLLLFVGWEGVGLCSYLLIGFWFEKKENAVAGMKAFLVNRVGDFGFLVGLLALFFYVGTAAHDSAWTLDIPTLREKMIIFPKGDAAVTAICLCLFLGAAGKSAQIPLYTWLPDAMAGPTPVSALIHAATMVTAGVYMVARMSFLFALSPVAMTVVALVGILTALFAATIGFCQTDIKKVLAYSTVSQLGFMFVGVGVGAFAAGIFHLFTHAFFKACLFLGSGNVIHGMHHEQDIRRMGGLAKFMPLTAASMGIATLAICALPPFALSGFYSKDAILVGAHGTTMLAAPWLGPAIAWAGVLAAGLTAFYMTRMYALTFLGRPRGDPHAHPHEAPWNMIGPVAILGAFSIFAGWLGVEAFVEKTAPTRFDVHHPAPLILGAIAASLAGMGLAAWLYVASPGLPARIAAATGGLYRLVLNKYFVDEAYDRAVVRPAVGLAAGLGRFDYAVIDGAVDGSAAGTAACAQGTGTFDNEIIDAAVNGTAGAVLAGGRHVRRVQAGNVKGYVAVAVTGAIFLIVVGSVWLMRDELADFVKQLGG